MKRIQVVDELKGLAISLVILVHSSLPNYFQGQLGVDIFLFVSGFTLTVGSTYMPTWEFVKRRLARIYPPYWIALAFFLATFYFLIGFLGGYWRPFPLIAVFLGVQAFFPSLDSGNVNGSWWFMSLIKLSYGSFLIVRKKTSDLSFMALTCAVIVGSMTALYAIAGHSNSAGGSLAFFLPTFFIGILAGEIYRSGELNIRIDWKMIVAIVIFALIPLLGYGNGVYGVRQAGALMYVALWWILRNFLSRSSIGAKVLGWSAWLGTISYELYLFHFPLMTDPNIWPQVYRIVWGITSPNKMELIYAEFLGLGVAFLLALGTRWVNDKIFSRQKINRQYMVDTESK